MGECHRVGRGAGVEAAVRDRIVISPMLREAFEQRVAERCAPLVKALERIAEGDYALGMNDEGVAEPFKLAIAALAAYHAKSEAMSAERSEDAAQGAGRGT